MADLTQRSDVPSRRGLSGVGGKLLQRHRAQLGDDGGFTLVELLIVTVITPLVIGGLAVMMLAVFKVQSSVSSRLNGSSDIQATSAAFVSDVQSADKLTTNNVSTPAGCTTTGTRILSLQEQGIVVTYAVVAQGSQNNLVRLQCTSASSTVAATVSITWG